MAIVAVLVVTLASVALPCMRLALGLTSMVILHLVAAAVSLCMSGSLFSGNFAAMVILVKLGILAVPVTFVLRMVSVLVAILRQVSSGSTFAKESTYAMVLKVKVPILAARLEHLLLFQLLLRLLRFATLALLLLSLLLRRYGYLELWVHCLHFGEVRVHKVA